MSSPATIIDLRLLSQSDLLSLAAASSPCPPPPPPLPLALNRSIFNESAGSRKQSLTSAARGRGRPRIYASEDPPSAAAAAAENDDDRQQNLLIVSHLRKLLKIPPNPRDFLDFKEFGEKLVPFGEKVQSLDLHGKVANLKEFGGQVGAFGEKVQSLDLHGKVVNLGELGVSGSSFGRKMETFSNGKGERVNLGELGAKIESFDNLNGRTGDLGVKMGCDDLDRGVVNGKGEVVDLGLLGEKVDPFIEEIRRRTEGLKKEEELLGFMGGLSGKWGSTRRRRRIVDADDFGDHLPKGWKLLIALKRKDGNVWIYCRRYVSPSGKQLLSCKEVSSYISSLNGNQIPPVQPASVEDNSTPNKEKTTRNDSTAGASDLGNIVKENKSCSSDMPMSSNVPSDHEKQIVSHRNEDLTVTQYDIPECKKCCLTFGDKDAYMQHQLSYHQRSAKRRKIGKLAAEGLVLKGGKYECQICHEIFTENHCCTGHSGSHFRNHGLFPSDIIATSEKREEKLAEKSASDVHIFSSCTGDNIEQIEEPLSKKSTNEVHSTSSCRLGEHTEQREEPLSAIRTGQINDCDLAMKESEGIAQSSNLLDGKSISPIGDLVSTVHMNCTSEENHAEKYSASQLSDISNSACQKDVKPDNSKGRSCTVDDCRLKDGFEVNRTGDTASLDMLYASISNVSDTERKQPIEFYQSFTNSSPSGNLRDFDNNYHHSSLENAKSSLHYPLEMNASSCTLTSEIEHAGSAPKVDSLSQLIALPGNGSSFTIESYSTDILDSTLEDNLLDEKDASKETDFSRPGAYLGKAIDTDTAMFDELNDSCTDIAFVNSRSSGTGRNDPSTFNFFMKESKDEEMDRSYNFMDTCFGRSGYEDNNIDAGKGHITGTEKNAACRSDFITKDSAFQGMGRPSNLSDSCFPQIAMGLGEDGASNTMKNPQQVDLTLTSSPWLHSYDNLPMVDSIANQSTDVHTAGQKHGSISGFEDLRMDVAEPYEFFGMSVQSTIPVPETPVGLDLGDVGCAPGQLDWSLPLPNSVCQVTLVCAWCSREFSNQGYDIMEDTGSLGFLCPTCKSRMSGIS